MSSCSFLCLSGVSVILILILQKPGCDADQLDMTPPPDYDYNATFDYSFYSNASSEDLDKFSERYIERGKDEEAVTMVTTGSSTAALRVSQEIWMLIWTLMILNLQQQLQQTL